MGDVGIEVLTQQVERENALEAVFTALSLATAAGTDDHVLRDCEVVAVVEYGNGSTQMTLKQPDGHGWATLYNEVGVQKVMDGCLMLSKVSGSDSTADSLIQRAIAEMHACTEAYIHQASPDATQTRHRCALLYGQRDGAL
jgi:hypothetical protein